MWKSTFVFIVNLVLLTCFELPFQNKCKLEDSACLKTVAQAFLPQFVAGIEEIGVEQLDPLFIKRIDSSTAGLKLIASDVTIVGFKGTKLLEIKLNKSFTSLKLKLLADLNLNGKHDTSGNILLLPIVGKGDLVVTLRQIEVTVFTTISKVTENGKTNFRAEFKDFSYELRDKADLEFSNLFDGNEVLAAATKQMLHESSNEVILGIGGPFVRAVIDAIIRRINEFLNSFEADDLYIH